MELEMPTTAVCPLCNEEHVEIGLNKNDRPKFTCSTFKTTVNLRGSKERREEFLSERVQMAQDDSADPAGTDSQEAADADEDEPETPKTIEDILKNND